MIPTPSPSEIKYGNKPAFPRPVSQLPSGEVSGDHTGLTYRELMIALNMAALLHMHQAPPMDVGLGDISELAIDAADAVIWRLVTEDRR